MRWVRHPGILSGYSVLHPTGAEGIVDLFGEQRVPKSWSGGNFTARATFLHLQAAGSSRWVIDGQQVILDSMELLWADKGAQCEMVECLSDTRHLFYCLIDLPRVYELAGLESPRPQGTFRSFAQAARALRLLEELSGEFVVEQAHSTLAIHSLLQLLAIELRRLVNACPSQRRLQLPPALDRLRSYLEARPDRFLSVEEMAMVSRVSRAHLHSLCLEHWQETPARFQMSLRLQQARNTLLRLDDSVTEVAIGHGFQSSQHFARAFRQHFGMSPSEARKMAKPVEQ